ncbi:MAG: DUF4065 domain-containing protein [Thermoplasmatales archaeon]|nr:DUF4065 domain-containing protein [Thermoplasmatales archaeon]
MAKAMDVASFFIEALGGSNDPMTNLRLNKLVYFAQVWSLVRLGEPLFDEPMEAWKLGPVVVSVYSRYSGYEKKAIEEHDEYDIDVFSDEQKEILVDVAREYRRYSTSALVDLSHCAGGPWDRVHDENIKRKIEYEDILEHYSKEEPLPRFDPSKIPKGRIISKRDEKGRLVLPRDFDD